MKTKWPEGVTDDDVRAASAFADHINYAGPPLTASQWHRLALLLANHRIAGERAGVETSNKRADTIATALVKCECQVLELEKALQVSHDAWHALRKIDGAVCQAVENAIDEEERWQIEQALAKRSAT